MTFSNSPDLLQAGLIQASQDSYYVGISTIAKFPCLAANIRGVIPSCGDNYCINTHLSSIKNEHDISKFFMEKGYDVHSATKVLTTVIVSIVVNNFCP